MFGLDTSVDVIQVVMLAVMLVLGAGLLLVVSNLAGVMRTLRGMSVEWSTADSRRMIRLEEATKRLEEAASQSASANEAARLLVVEVARNLGIAQGAVDKVASNLADSERRADDVPRDARPGEAADAGGRSG